MERQKRRNPGRWAATLQGLLVLVTAVQAVAQPTRSYVPPSSNPEDLFVFEDHIYFSAEDGQHGRELWRVDDNGQAEMVKDIKKGPYGSVIRSFHRFDGQLYFCAGETESSMDLWRTDGSDTGTVMAVDIAGALASSGGALSIVGNGGGRMFLLVGTPGLTLTLWESDGTSAGTHRLKRPDTGLDVTTDVFHGAVSGGELYFNCERTHGIFTMARTVAGSSQVRVLRESTFGFNSFFTMEAGAVLFSGFERDTGSELWITEGEPESTRLVLDIYPGPESSVLGEMHNLPSAGTPSTVFVATTAADGREIWETDGTPEGTHMWKSIMPGAASSGPSSFRSNRDVLFFMALGEKTGKEIWRCDLESGTTMPVSDINPGLASSEPYTLCLTGENALYFSAEDQHGDEELWVCPAGANEVRRVADINPGSASSFPQYTVAFGQFIVTVATSPVYGRELWMVRNGDDLQLLADIYSDTSVNPSSHPREFTPAGDLLYFVANDITHGAELWCTNGMPEGTRMVKDIFQEERASSNPTQLTAVGDLLYFVAEDGIHGYELWRSDGTALGTAMLTEIGVEAPARIKGLTAYQGNLIFGAYRPHEGEEPWIVRPGKEPDVLIDIRDGGESSMPRDFTVWNGQVYFRADDGVHGEELWRTNGTRGGTAMVKDVIDAPVARVHARSVTGVFGHLFLAAEVDHRGVELWRLDPDGQSLTLLGDIARGGGFDVLLPPTP